MKAQYMSTSQFYLGQPLLTKEHYDPHSVEKILVGLQDQIWPSVENIENTPIQKKQIGRFYMECSLKKWFYPNVTAFPPSVSEGGGGSLLLNDISSKNLL